MSETIQLKDLVYIGIIISLVVGIIAITSLYLHERRARTLNVLQSLSRNVEPILTKREIEIYLLQKQEYSAKQIAEKLNISKSTVDTHSKNMNKKLREAGMLPV